VRLTVLIVAGGYTWPRTLRVGPPRAAHRSCVRERHPSPLEIVISRVQGFAWDKFFLVGKWALVSYVIAAGLIEFAFVKDHTRGGALAVITAMLVLFAVTVR